jgi:hypothetical protein
MAKRGQIFATYILVLTLVMCGMVIFLYFAHQGHSKNSLVSPKAVFEFRDDVRTYEILERKLILESLEEAGDFSENGFAQSFKEVFLDKINKEREIKELLFKNISREASVRANERDYLKSIYVVGREGERVIFSRVSAEKNLRLKAEKTNQINFPVDFKYRFEKKYLISFVDNSFILEEE